MLYTPERNEVLRERLLKAQVLATATVVLIGCPALFLFISPLSTRQAEDGEIPGLSALITTVATVLLFTVTAAGGAVRSTGLSGTASHQDRAKKYHLRQAGQHEPTGPIAIRARQALCHSG